MSSLELQALPLPGLYRVRRQLLCDERGSFSRLFCTSELAAVGWTQPVAQVNHSITQRRGIVRGLHYQRHPHAEMKLVACVRGQVWDVAVDLRSNSPTYLRWHAERLSAEEGSAMLIPAGCAHGFQALTDDAQLIYCHSAAFAPDAEAGIHVLDSRLAIEWPLPVEGLSSRDANLPFLKPGVDKGGA